mmetsp:Transcript_89009/g.153953  ORF Transcript_89009/g.153953 Transcript_89009/m.153953 type:complete len:234 (-) Transcript_89009:69-770(-)
MAYTIKMCLLMILVVVSLVSATPAKKQAFMHRKDIQQFQKFDQEAKTIIEAHTKNNAGDEAKSSRQKPDDDTTTKSSTGSLVSRVAMQLVFGLIYYMIIVSKYPTLSGEPTPAARKLQAVDELSAMFEVSFVNCIMSWLCSGPRAAHTFYSTGISDYWCSLFGMSLFPCCVLCVANSFTDLNEKLGGQKRGLLMSCLCSYCCSCCVIAQDAESLDLSTGVKTGFCGVYPSRSL